MQESLGYCNVFLFRQKFRKNEKNEKNRKKGLTTKNIYDKLNELSQDRQP